MRLYESVNTVAEITGQEWSVHKKWAVSRSGDLLSPFGYSRACYSHCKYVDTLFWWTKLSNTFLEPDNICSKCTVFGEVVHCFSIWKTVINVVTCLKVLMVCIKFSGRRKSLRRRNPSRKRQRKNSRRKKISRKYQRKLRKNIQHQLILRFQYPALLSIHSETIFWCAWCSFALSRMSILACYMKYTVCCGAMKTTSAVIWCHDNLCYYEVDCWCLSDLMTCRVPLVSNAQVINWWLHHGTVHRISVEWCVVCTSMKG